MTEMASSQECSPGTLLPSLILLPPVPAFSQPWPLHTFILSWVVNVEVSVPHNCQLHWQVVDLHPFIGILQPDRGGKGSMIEVPDVTFSSNQ